MACLVHNSKAWSMFSSSRYPVLVTFNWKASVAAIVRWPQASVRASSDGEATRFYWTMVTLLSLLQLSPGLIRPCPARLAGILWTVAIGACLLFVTSCREWKFPPTELERQAAVWKRWAGLTLYVCVCVGINTHTAMFPPGRLSPGIASTEKLSFLLFR